MNTEELFPEFDPISPSQQEILRLIRFMPDDPFPAFITPYSHHQDDTEVLTQNNQHIHIASSSSTHPNFLVDLQGVVHSPMEETYLLSARNHVDVSHCFLNTGADEDTPESMDVGNDDVPNCALNTSEEEIPESMNFGNVGASNCSFNAEDYQTLDSMNFQNNSDIGFQPCVEQNGEGDGDDDDDDDDDDDSESPTMTEHDIKSLVFNVLRVVADYSKEVADKKKSCTFPSKNR